MIDSEKITQAVEILYPYTTHNSGDKKQAAINDAFEILEWGHITPRKEVESNAASNDVE